jgi:hypothetical protein
MTEHADKPSLRVELDLALREHAPIGETWHLFSFESKRAI